jgi:protein-disulfide isomerase
VQPQVQLLRFRKEIRSQGHIVRDNGFHEDKYYVPEFYRYNVEFNEEECRMYGIVCALAMMLQAPSGTTQTSYAGNYLLGNTDSPVRIELFSDFQCPSCRNFYLNTVTSLMREYSAGNKVAIMFREFPLSIHPVARTATRYALATKSLGRDQWIKAIEQLYTCQAEWSYDGKIEPVLSRILTPDEMQTVKAKLTDPSIEKDIDQDVALGKEKKVESTPTVYVTVGGKEQRLVGGLAFPIFKDFIDRSLK